MNGLRVYINPDEANTLDYDSVFYSCREGGPYYRWRYEQSNGQWIFSRVQPVEFTIKSLSPANWKDVPAALQARLNEHYLE
jgi:hypothetical protein